MAGVDTATELRSPKFWAWNRYLLLSEFLFRCHSFQFLDFNPRRHAQRSFSAAC